ncbi:hypothetical protein COCNU_12G006490 [Cocos nucifera]|uniref:ADP/ATP translocase n=1 Tax=Cocos nucifera TaxID=13894 RepID=A0A8K0IRL9_COCNU|nr:hypothetical protein COCNU_12G006490 [Cocos nucifera]
MGAPAGAATASWGEKMAADVVMGGAAAAVAKSVGGAGDAPARKLREMLKRGHQRRPYRGIADRLLRALREESLLSLWRGNQANVIRYFPTQVGGSSKNSTFLIQILRVLVYLILLDGDQN